MAFVKHALRQAFRRSGALNLARYINRRSLRMVMYHRFPKDPRSLQGLEQQCSHFRKHYTPTSMSEAVSALQQQRPLPPNALVVTIDDGHRDFYEVAWPVFSAYRIPTIVYLVTDFIDQTSWLWPDCIEYALLHTPATSLELPLNPKRILRLTLNSPEAKTAALDSIKRELKLLSNESCLMVLQTLLQILKVSVSEKPVPEHAALTWKEACELAAAGVEFGAHTKSHPMLSKIECPEQLEREILCSQRYMESKLNRAVRHFCYPNGDFDDRAEKIVRANFDSAATTRRGINYLDRADRFQLERLGVDPDSNYFLVEQYLAGSRVRGAHIQ